MEYPSNFVSSLLVQWFIPFHIISGGDHMESDHKTVSRSIRSLDRKSCRGEVTLRERFSPVSSGGSLTWLDSL